MVRDREQLRQLAKVGRYADHLARAPTAIALVRADATNEHRLRTFLWDLDRAAQDMLRGAWELGIGSVTATVYDLELASRLPFLPNDQRCDSCSPSVTRLTPRPSPRPTGPAGADSLTRSSARTAGSARRREGAPAPGNRAPELVTLAR